MKILILGGTQFLGRHMTEAALKAGHEVTLFNRGKTNQQLFPNVKKLIGDRNDDLKTLKKGVWDAIIDISGYVPSQVKATTELLQKRVNHYTFISTVSVYEDFSNGPVNEENTSLAELTEETEEINGETYGPLKSQCEEIVRSRFREQSLVIRPGLIVGPYDHTDRFTYWVYRIGEGGTVLAPGEPDREIQWIDARDLTEWVIRMVEQQATGTFNAAGLSASMENLLNTVQRVTNADAQIEWVADDFLVEKEIGAFVDMPFWIPKNKKYPTGFVLADASKAMTQGLTFRPIEETVSDTYMWQAAREDHKWRAGLSNEKEKELLEQYYVKINK
ncbi:NAD-dependent epimerase/dehydratase family protein [Jeotgalibacillus soli]|uniref:UDP-glucose 4-epimerase n=1 Tax=Jeotgalibacillus soli TaxID=889306 RepID=A0A0C2VTB9_9BACL|nr:NAD-dependent epimerase/dehydratase family protein [Jeotgalibacillus soli]KIL52172.1 hypothetical protein KP78_05420 [Jeotgalibacillus soli]